MQLALSSVLVRCGFTTTSFARFLAVAPLALFPAGANMVAVSGALIFAGYQLMVYGWSQVRGSNAGFFDLLWPGRYNGSKPDSSGSATPGPSGSTPPTVIPFGPLPLVP